MKNIYAIIAVVGLLIAPAALYAADATVAGPVIGSDQYSLDSNAKTAGNLYVGAGNSLFQGTVTKDLVTAGGTVMVSGPVTGDVLLAGGTVNITGTVGDDVRLFAGTVTVTNAIGGDLVVAGGSVKVTSNATVGGNALIAAGTLELSANIKGNARLAGGTVTIDGPIAGSVNVAAEHLTLGAHAVIGGDVLYHGNEKPVITQGAVIKGQLTQEPLNVRGPQQARNFVSAIVSAKFFMVLIAGLIALWWFKQRSTHLVLHALNNFGKEILRGVLLLILLPIIFILLAITIFGLPLTLIGFLFYAIALCISKIFAGIILGTWLIKVVMKKTEYAVTWQAVVVGDIVLGFLGFVPFIGGLFGFVLTVAGFGSLLGMLYHFLRAKQVH